MGRRGFLSAGGAVTRSRRPDTIGEVRYLETRYNLRRVYVTREWIIHLDNGTKTRGPLRRDALDKALKARHGNADT